MLAESGTWMRMLHCRQRTVLPRALGGTERMDRHLRLGQIMRTLVDMPCSGGGRPGFIIVPIVARLNSPRRVA